MTLVSLIGSIATVITVSIVITVFCTFVCVGCLLRGLFDLCFGGAEVIWVNVAGLTVREGDAVPVGRLGLAGDCDGLVEGEGA